MSEDEFGGLLDRESALAGGTSARRAATVLFLIESRTAQLVAQSRQVMDKFLTEDAAEQRDLAFLEAFALGQEPPVRPTVRDLERYAPRWQPLVPRNPRVQAALARRLGEKYRITRATTPALHAALGLDDADVRQAYQRLFRRPIDSIYAPRVSARERIAWAWSALAGRLENLPPFWTVFALTLTETVGVTILALPIALAKIGALPGVAIMVVLGLVNVVTIAYLTESVARDGAIRYGTGFLGKVVEDFLGRIGSVVLSVGIFVLAFVIVQVFYIGFARALDSATGVPAVLWVGVLFLLGLYFIRRPSLDATVASALVVGAVNVVLVVALTVIAFTHVRPEYLLHNEVPFLSGRPFEPEIVGLVFGVVLVAYFGHLSMGTCARVVLQRDPTGRSLIWGASAATLTAVLLYCVFVLAVNGAIAPDVLAGETGTVLDPLAAAIGPVVYLLGSVFVVLGLGMASVQYMLVLFQIVRERIPAPSRPVVLLGRREGVLLLSERGRGARSGLRMGLVYLGRSGGEPRFRLDLELAGTTGRVERSTAGSWEALGENGDRAVLDRMPALRDRGTTLSIEVLDADHDAARVRVTSSLRQAYESTRDGTGLDLVGVLALPEGRSEVVTWILRRGAVSVAEVAAYLDRDEDATRTLLRELEQEGVVAEQLGPAGEQRYGARLAHRRRGSAVAWEALREDGSTRPGDEAPRLVRARGLSRVVSGRYGSSAVSLAPVVVAFLITEWLLLTGRGSFTALLGLMGVLVIPLLGGIFPVLMLISSRRKGERVPRGVSRLLGHPVLLAVVYLVFLASIFLHGLVIWTELWQRVLALAVGVLVVGLTLALRGSFTRRAVVELRQEGGDEAGQTAFALTAAGSPADAEVTLAYADGDEQLVGPQAVVPRFSRLQRAIVRPAVGTAVTELKVWAHRVTPEGDSEGLAGTLQVSQGGDIREVDLKLARGQVVLPLAPGSCRVEIILT